MTQDYTNLALKELSRSQKSRLRKWVANDEVIRDKGTFALSGLIATNGKHFEESGGASGTVEDLPVYLRQKADEIETFGVADAAEFVRAAAHYYESGDKATAMRFIVKVD